MPTELDVYRSAAVLIEHHGKGATRRAMEHANTMRDDGNVEARTFWLDVVRAIDELQKGNAGGRGH